MTKKGHLFKADFLFGSFMEIFNKQETKIGRKFKFYFKKNFFLFYSLEVEVVFKKNRKLKDSQK